MPTIELSLSRLEKLLGKDCTIKDLELDLQWIGLDLEDVREDEIKVEYNPNRPDFSSPEGIARALRGYYEMELGLPEFEMKDSGYEIKVDPEVKKVRPYIVTAIVRNIDLDDEEVATLMNVQEDLHWAIGRGRKKVAIGVHDLDKIEPPFLYTAIKPDGHKFEPLQMPGFMLTPAEILVDHPKGREYAHILDGAEVYPIIFDRNKDVISFPPIINGTLTMVTDDTKNLFIDMTGTDLKSVNYALNVLCTMLADMDCDIETCTNIYEGKAVVSPNLDPVPWTVKEEFINSYLGLNLSQKEIIKSLQKVRLDAKAGKKKGELEVLVPAYRGDLYHPVDFTEEVATGYGYFNLPTTLPVGGTGKYHEKLQIQSIVRKIFIGMGFQEVVNFVLTNRAKSFEATRREIKKGVEIIKPVSKEYDTTRQELIPGLLQNLQDNKHQPIPINIFEVGDVIMLDKKEETGAKRIVHAACVMYDKDTEYTGIRSVLDAFMEMQSIEGYEVIPVKHPYAIDGRAGGIVMGKKKIGLIGELHPEILDNFDLDYPVTFLELNLENL